MATEVISHPFQPTQLAARAAYQVIFQHLHGFGKHKRLLTPEQKLSLFVMAGSAYGGWANIRECSDAMHVRMAEQIQVFLAA